jgi:nitrous oxide reductase accessory protein NosL
MSQEVIRDFGNSWGSRQDAREYAAKKGGIVHYDETTRTWTVIQQKHPQGWNDEDEAWGFKA